VPLLALATTGSGALEELLHRCGFSRDASLYFEYTVPPAAGKGKASHTDLMVIEGPSAMAIEAKWTEPPSQLVRDWLGPEPTDNRQAVFRGWINLIEKRIVRSLQAADLASISYQIVHRAASACASAERPQLAYLQFVSTSHGGDGSRHRLDDLNKLYTALGRPTAFPFHLIQIEIEVSAEFEQLGNIERAELPDAVRSRLQTQSLFHFRRPKLLTLEGE
jgi:hypothetical protein